MSSLGCITTAAVTMETGAPVHTSSVSAQTERRMDAQAPLTAVYIHTVPAVPPPQFPQPALASPDPTAQLLTMPPLYSKETLPFLTLHIASGLQPGMSMTAAAPTARPKSAGKHLCPHCGRDCMKPSVLEKHLRCHTGERPYPCTVCGVSFKTQSNLYKHKRTQAHARLSSESEQSLDSMSSSTTSLSVEERGEEPAGLERDVPVAEKTPVVVNKVGQNERSQKTLENAQKCEDNPSTEKDRPAPSPSRHLLLQRQEATLFSKQWESSTSSSKSQSHESTDSGFSESSDHYPSPGSLLPDHSMDSLAESTTEHLDDTTSQLQDHQEGKDTTKEHKSLEERISKLISENSAVVEDKHLENVRPRKTVLSKQGSIDLPMPYTYKDSFHFDMRINKLSNTQRTRKPCFYNSVPTQQSTAMDHAPLTRSNSLPFSVALLQPDISSPTSSYHRDYTLFRRGSAGQIHPTGFSIKSVNQQLSTHRPLVRQAAVDCNHATDALCKNSSVEEACTSSTQCNGESGDICGEPSKDRKFRRKKAQKFAYNKWYMYGGGTFKKLYDTDRGGENSAVKGMKSLPNPESEFSHSLQKRLSAGHNETAVVSSPNLARSATVHNLESYPARLQLMPSFNTQPSHIFATSATQRLPLRRNLSLSLLPLSTIVSFAPNQNIDPNIRSEASNLVNVPPCSASQNQVHIPSDRKKQKTDDKPCPQETETQFASQHSSSICTMTQPKLSQMIQPKHTQVSLFPVSTISTANASKVSNAPPVTSVSSTVQSSFMPKYQLKLPNACLSSLLHTKLAQNDSLSSTASIVNTMSSTKVDTITTWTYQNICSSTTSQFLPCTISQTSSQVNVSSPFTVVQQRPVADTKTTTSLRNSHALIQCSPFGTAMPLPTSNTKTKADLPFTSIHRTQSAPAAFTVLNQNQQHFSFQKSTPSPLAQSSQSNGSNIISNISPIPCPVVSGEQAVPKVFHMQTADLQICFQILSDEQLALIEPQIEKQTDTSLLQTGQVDPMPNQASKNMVESHDKESGQSETNQEVHKDIAKPPICNKSEKEQPTIHTTQAPVIHPHIQVNKVAKSCEGGEVSTTAQYEGAKSERIQIAEIKECFAAQKQISHAKSDKQNVTDFALSSSNNEVTNCKGNLIEIQTEDVLSKSNNIPVTLNISSGLDRSDCGANETRLASPFPKIQVQNSQLISLPRSNPPHPTVTLSSPQQTKACSEKVDLLNDLNLSHEANLEQSAVVTSVSSDVRLAAPRDVPAASTNIPHLSTGLLEGGSMVRLESQTEGHTGVTEQSHGPLQTERDTATYIQLENKAEDPRVKADSFPNSWISEQHLQHLFHTPSGMSIYPPQSSGSSPKVSSLPALPNNTDYCNLPPSLLLNCYSSQESGMDHLQAQALCEANLNKLSVKEPQQTDISNSQARCEEKLDQRLEDENCLVTATTKRSHISELTKIYQSSTVFINPMRQSEPFYSEHISRDEPQESLDATTKYPSLFGAGLSYSYQPGDPQSSAVRVVQTSVEQEDSSSDDEGKLIIEL